MSGWARWVFADSAEHRSLLADGWEETLRRDFVLGVSILMVKVDA